MSDSKAPRYNGRTARELASDAENSLLGIVHLAEADETPLDVEQIFGTLSGVTRMLEHVPEVITRMRAAALHQHEADRLAITAGQFVGDPDAAARSLTDAVDAVLAGFGTVRMNMEKAQATLSDASFTGETDGHLA